MTTTTREQAVLAAAEALLAGRAYTGLSFPAGASPFQAAQGQTNKSAQGPRFLNPKSRSAEAGSNSAGLKSQ